MATNYGIQEPLEKRIGNGRIPKSVDHQEGRVVVEVAWQVGFMRARRPFTFHPREETPWKSRFNTPDRSENSENRANTENRRIQFTQPYPHRKRNSEWI